MPNDPAPLTDAQLQDFAGLAERLAAARLVILKDRSPVHVPTAFEAVALAGWPEDAIHALLAEVVRLRAELAEAERLREDEKERQRWAPP